MNRSLSRFFIDTVLVMWLSAAAAMAQLPSLPKSLGGQQVEAAKSAETPEETTKRLELWLREAREALARLDEVDPASMPKGLTATEIDERKRTLGQIVIHASNTLVSLAARNDAIKAAEDSRASASAWNGFKEPPPYSVLLLDELTGEREAVRAKLATHESSLANFERVLAGVLADAKADGDVMARATAALQNAQSDAMEVARWALDSAKAKSRLHAVRAALIEASIENLRQAVAAAKADLELLDRKIRTVRADVRFTDEEFERIGKRSEERAKAVSKEILSVEKRIPSALRARQMAIDGLESSGAAPIADDDPVRLKLATAEVRLDSLQSMRQLLESLIELENQYRAVYFDRRALMGSADSTSVKAVAESLAKTAGRLRVWREVIESDSTATGADLAKLESRAAALTAADPRTDEFDEQRASLSEKLAMQRRTIQAVKGLEERVGRWLEDHAPRTPESIDLSARIGALVSSVPGWLSDLWSLAIVSFEDRVEVDGQTITGKVSVTLGMLLGGLLFFVLGWFVASRILRRIQRTLVRRGYLFEAQARTLRKWLMLSVSALLLIGTLSYLNIPLTIFAFLGGALAIGVGFGTQTLIKNFISGIILLVERKIRVGDVVEVDGVLGTVAEVNTRSSVIRTADDQESIVPNSMFLENRVTNLTLTSSTIRKSLRIGVDYGTPPALIMDILTEVAGRHGRVCKDPAPFAVFEDFGHDALVFSLYYWIELGSGANPAVIASDLRLMVEKRLGESAIRIPYPQRDMHLATERPIRVEILHSPADE
jgi:potassium efflux system protein